MMRWIALYAPVRWPAGILTTPELDQDAGGTRPAEFEADVAELERLLMEVATDRRDRRSGTFIRCSAECRSRRGCDGRTSTRITISVSLACRANRSDCRDALARPNRGPVTIRAVGRLGL